MKKLFKILNGIKANDIIGDKNIKIAHISFDSRDIKPNNMFIAIKGHNVDGHNYIKEAISLGSKAVVCSIKPNDIIDGITYIIVDNTAHALGIIASNFYDNPSYKLKLVGVTGTNGKTTTTYTLYQLTTLLGNKVGLISTLENIIINNKYKSFLTTPDPIYINKLLAEMVDNGCTYCFMEVSSHGIVQHRLDGLNFTGGVFLNITHDHLDYHKSFNEYIKAKKMFFDNLSSKAFALINLDDNKSQVMAQNTKAKVYTFAMHNIADFTAKCYTNFMNGLEIIINGHSAYFSLLGDFNTQNILAAYSVANILGFKDEYEVIQKLSLINLPKGRLELTHFNNSFYAIVDYAHTPDSLYKVLKNLSSINFKNGKIITVIGCGGDRDKEKRPLMGKIAINMSNLVIFTSDNPRYEKPKKIIDDMTKDLTKEDQNKVLHIVNRQSAIVTAVDLATKGDIILIAGKGHEDYQEINGIKYLFNDLAILESLGFKKVKDN